MLRIVTRHEPESVSSAHQSSCESS